MRLVLLILAALACLGNRCDPQTGPPTWFLVAGQSNAIGVSTQATDPAPGLVFRPDGAFLRSVVDPIVHLGQTSSGPWPSFARRLPGPTGVIAAASPATCLIDFQNCPGRWNADGGDLVQLAIETWTELGSPVLDAVLWYQGESDALNWQAAGLTAEEARTAYREELMALADAFVAAFNAPILVTPVSLRWCVWENAACDPAQFEPDRPEFVPIVEATEDVVALHAWVGFGPVTHDLRHEPDGIHIWDVNELGRRFAVAVDAF